MIHLLLLLLPDCHRITTTASHGTLLLIVPLVVPLHAVFLSLPPVVPLYMCTAAHRVACHATVRCCLSHRLSRCRALLPMVLPVAPSCAAARRITHRAAVCCCQS